MRNQVKHSDGTQMSFGTAESCPKALKTGTLFPKRNTKAAKKAVASVKKAQKEKHPFLFVDTLNNVKSEHPTIQKFVRKFIRKNAK